MGMMIIRHKVRDYGQWRPIFDRHAKMQKAAGLSNPRVYHSAYSNKLQGARAPAAKTARESQRARGPWIGSRGGAHVRIRRHSQDAARRAAYTD